MNRLARWLVVLLLPAAATFAQQTQSGCTPPEIPAVPPGANMFTPQQEVYVGDFLAEQGAPSHRVIDDKELTAYLERIGSRVVQNLPPSQLQYRFYVSDAPITNAFSIVGGRVYVTRKLIANAHSEDEVAGVIGHELGHIVTHQQAIVFSKIFRERLGINEVTDRKDVYAKMNRMYDEWTVHRPVFVDSEEDQMIADRVGVIATIRAGYSPQALADFWDRFTENKGKTGNWFSDFVGSTTPNTKRYREMLKTISAASPSCTITRSASSSDEFKKWQLAVTSFRGSDTQESLHNVIWRKPLDPPLQDGIHTVKFSPDGNFAFAQDTSNIYVLSHEPFQPLFRIDAPDAYSAQFSPDSQSIVFYDRSLRVERWDIKSQQRSSVSELYIYRDCYQTKLSPDGNVMACLREDRTLTLVDVASGDLLFEKKDFTSPSTDFGGGLGSYYFRFQLKLVTMGFSTDGRYFVAGSKNENAIGFDLRQKQPVALGGQLKNLVGVAFAFLGPDRLIGHGGDSGGQSAIVEFPSGKVIKSVELGAARPFAAAQADYVLLRPIRDFAVGILDVKTDQIIRASKLPTIDVYGHDSILELRNGHIGLVSNIPPAPNMPPMQPIELVLPAGAVDHYRAVGISDDLNWLALSGNYRGGVWDLNTGRRYLNLRPFHGAYIKDGVFTADFPKQDTLPRAITQVSLPQKQFNEIAKPEDIHLQQMGPYFVSFHSAKKDDASQKRPNDDALLGPEASPEGVNLHINLTNFENMSHDMVLEVHELGSAKPLWTRAFPKEAPRHYSNWRACTVTLIWPMDTNAARSEIGQHPDWKKRYPGAKESDLLVEVLDMRTGQVINGLILNTGQGSIHLQSARSVGNWLITYDSRRRIAFYSLATGIETGKVFGELMAVGTSDVACVQTEPGKLVFYDMNTLAVADETTFVSSVSSASFLPDGKRLFVLTSDQTAFLVAPSASSTAGK